MRQLNIKQFIFLLGLCLPTLWTSANNFSLYDGYSQVPIIGSLVHGDPKDSSIQASIDGHTLTVVFTENLGQVTVEVSRFGGGETQVESTPTPNGVLFYIYATGSYIVTFSLPNGDEYYGEFEVTD